MDYKKILVRATNWLGDAVMSLPALRALRQRFPDAEIAILAKPWVAETLYYELRPNWDLQEISCSGDYLEFPAFEK